MNNLLRRRASIDEALYRKVDDGERGDLNLFAIGVPISSVVIFALCTVAAAYAFDNYFIGGLIGSIMGLLFYKQDASLPYKGMGAAIWRLFLSLLLAVVLSVPLKTIKVEQELIVRIYEAVEQHNIRVDKYQARDLLAIEKQGEKLMAARTQAGAEYAAAKAEGKRPSAQPIADTRRQYQAYLESKDAKIALVKAKYKDDYQGEPTITKVALMNAYIQSLQDDTGSLIMALLMTVCLFLVESIPVIMRIRLHGGEYLQMLLERKQLVGVTRGSVSDVNTQLAGARSVEEVDHMATERELLQAIEREAENGFENPQALREVAAKLNGNGSTYNS